MQCHNLLLTETKSLSGDSPELERYRTLERQGNPIFVRLETVEPQTTFAPAKDSKQVAIDDIAFAAPGPAPASSHPSTAVTYDQD